MHQKYKQVTV